MDETSTDSAIITVDQFDSICRTCLCSIQGTVAFNLCSDLLIQKDDSDPKISQMLDISSILSQLTSISVSDSVPTF